MNASKKEQKNIKEKAFERRWMIAAGIVILFIISALVFSLFQPEPKPDPASKKTILELAAKQLKIDPNEFTEEDFALITKFVISGKELADIDLLEKFKNLQQLQLLYLRYPESTIPKWMKILAKLGIFDLNENFAVNLKPLSKLLNLRELYK